MAMTQFEKAMVSELRGIKKELEQINRKNKLFSEILPTKEEVSEADGMVLLKYGR